MNTMERFVAATKPVLERMLKGTGVRATYRLTERGGEVRLTLDFCSSVSFDEEHVGAFFEDNKAEEVQSLVMGHLEVLADAAASRSRFAPVTPHIELPGTMVVKDKS